MNPKSEITIGNNASPEAFTKGEMRLIRIFNEYLLRLFAHDNVCPGEPIREHIEANAWDDIQAAGDVAADNAELAATLCRRAERWHDLGKELAEFLCLEGPHKLDDLPTVQSMDYGVELEEKYGAEMLRAAEHRAEVAP